MGWNIHQMDVKISFLNGIVKEEVYIKQREGFEINKINHFCKLKKSQYSLKQSPRVWYSRMDAYLLRFGFVKSTTDTNLYIKVVDSELVIIILYVDNLFITSVHHYLKYVNEEVKLIVFTNSD